MSKQNLTHKYIPRIEQIENNRFIEEYYSSSDVSIAMNNEEQSEISYIQYTIQEQLKPIYGYNSRTMDECAIGNRIVTGIFKMPIKNPRNQSTYKEVVVATAESDVEDYNNTEENETSKKEWIVIGNTNSEFVKDNARYAVRLHALGYLTTDNPTTTELKNAIRKFQANNKLTVSSSGEIDANTAYMINIKYDMSISDGSITLISGTKLYSGPNQSYSVVSILTDERKAYIKTKYNDTWYCVLTESGDMFYVMSNSFKEES